MAAAALAIAEPAPNAAMASRSDVSNTRSPALAVPPPRMPGVKVSHRPMIEDDGSEIVRAPVSIREVVTP
ncbi:hypothetical protein D3C85_1657210 [compost metagenome]